MHRTQRRRARGMTLIELLVVLVILGLIASLAGPQVFKYVTESKAKAARIDIENIGQALNAFFLDVGRYPTTQEGLRSLVEKPAGQAGDRWKGPYLKKLSTPKDPWQNEYIYRSPGSKRQEFDLISLGADGREGGEGADRDISNADD